MKTYVWLLLIVLLLIAVAGYWFYMNGAQTPVVRSFEECAAAGYPVMESYPRRCNDARGNSFTENIGNVLDKQNLIVSAFPTAGALITSPVIATGEARGTWYFEASFPITLEDSSGNVIGEGYAEAQSDWMTEDFVPYISIPITFSPQTPGSTGTLVLYKDNPSGEADKDDWLEIPVTF
jgi:hypothetical protein